ncbi:MAG: NAD-dependent malic enzyme [Planctomycetota bacterium]|nr:NAD-dependent malic enzyme [Planctomycetota bacterium]
MTNPSGSPTTTSLTGTHLIDTPLLNKGTAFSEQERHLLLLEGLLPPHYETLDEQVARCYEAFSGQPTDLEKHVYLRNLQDTNETLFYRLMLDHITEMMPIVYTPIVGLACQKFSHIYRRPRGVFISYPERAHMDHIFSNVDRDIEVIVVTDGERILGLGDQGAGGMGIPIGKLSLYTLCGGIAPEKTLPILLDLGTNNEERLKDPTYIGWRKNRIRDKEYDDFIEQFVQAVMKRFPDVLLQWEDFASADAAPILDRYRDKLCTFNDDIQGTAAVATGTILSALEVAQKPLSQAKIVMLGAGSAGLGITLQLQRTMVREGLSEQEAKQRCFVIDQNGLLCDDREGLNETLQQLAQKREDLSGWDCGTTESIGLDDVVRNAKPDVLVGVTGVAGLFTEEVIRDMATHVDRPIIFPLSNPTSRAEATPANLLNWTDGKALVATGSPFDPVTHAGKEFTIAQCNNSYIFPAMGLAIRSVGARRVLDEMFMAAGLALREVSPALKNPQASLLPCLEDMREVSLHIAKAVAVEAVRQGVADDIAEEEIDARLQSTMWVPEYQEITLAK